MRSRGSIQRRSIEYRLTNGGRTVAHIIDSAVLLAAADVSALPEQPIYREPSRNHTNGFADIDRRRDALHNTILLPNSAITRNVELRLMPEEVKDLRAQRIQLIFYGLVDYRDAFDQGRISRFCFVSRVLPLLVLPLKFEVGGSPSYNRYTLRKSIPMK
jgi:hypothetical protein